MRQRSAQHHGRLRGGCLCARLVRTPQDLRIAYRPSAECLNAHRLPTLGGARKTLEVYRGYYGEDRPHGAIGQRPPTALRNQGGIASQPP
ncbi:transposase [Roseomonas sp. HJA6]|uniref:Transposase n=1 Tax=Roseomonas alba TaxID=2846776 RepID=A0ABS7AAC4_9PROT|nr:transposase [Neoroseomonas alba]